MRRLRLQRIDDLTREDHFFLEPEDRVYFLREYTSRVGFRHSETNQLISNLKKTLDRRGQNDWRYKDQAIRQCAAELGDALRRPPDNAVWVPVPPSKARTDPLYDDRLQRILALAFPHETCMDLVVQATSVLASHRSDSRPRPNDLVANYQIDKTLTPPSHRFIIFDDVLTTGCHFKAAQTVLMAAYPGARCIGIVLARRVFPEADGEDAAQSRP